MTTSSRCEELVPAGSEKTQPEGNGSPLFLAVAVGIAGGALALWCGFDHAVPSWDAAGHLLNGLSYRDLFRHAKPFDLHWYHQLLTVNCFYPPLTYVLAGAVKTVLGTSLWTDSLMKVFYLTVLNVSVYGLVSKLTKDRLAAVFSLLVVNLYPEVAAESHKSMLDFPVMSMTALSLFALASWNEKRDWKRASLVALATAAALMTKQVCAAFLLLPFAYYALGAAREKRWNQVAMLVSSGLAAGAALIPWMLVSAPTIKKVAAEIQVALGNKQVSDVFFSNVVAYIGFIPVMATPFLLIVAIASVFLLRRERHKQLAVLWLSALSGLIALSTLTWQYALPRYFISALIVLAAYTGCALATLWRAEGLSKRAAGATEERRNLLRGRAVVAALLLTGAVGYTAINFSPYPLAENRGLDFVRAVSLRPVTKGTKDRFEHPCPDEDWGIGWALWEIKNRDGDAPVWLNVLPSTQQINVHAFEYFARHGSFQVKPTTSRSWSAAGDSSKFHEEDALHYQWYLLKTGEQGFKFHDHHSRVGFNQLVNFIETGGKFELISEKSLPDGSIASLYRQR
ncbi:glycosyltransferase family 39 protein [Candidatus Obscuribacterales bacterium]|nr:glycosyltransferase family 39 protein [Candidatus Obscuribacterales bacterium]